MVHDCSILEATGLPFIRVAYDCLGIATCVSNRLPLHTRWEAGTTPACQTTIGNDLDELSGSQFTDGQGKAVITAGTTVTIDARSVGLPDVPEDAFFHAVGVWWWHGCWAQFQSPRFCANYNLIAA